MTTLAWLLACGLTRGGDVPGATFEPAAGVVIDARRHTARIDGQKLEGPAAMVAVAGRVTDAVALAQASLALVDTAGGEEGPWLQPIGGAYPADIEAMAAPPARTGGELVYWRRASGQVADLARCVVTLDSGTVACVNGGSLRSPDALLAGGDVYMRLNGVRGLEARGDTARLLDLALNDADARVRRGCVESLGRLRAGTAEGLGRILLFDGYPEVRKAAADALGALGDPAGRDALEKALAGDADASVRTAAREALAGGR